MKQNMRGTLYMSQDEFRVAVLNVYPSASEEVVKYNYDRYTYYMKVQPIRKIRTRKRIGRGAYWIKLDLSKFTGIRDGYQPVQMTGEK